MKILYLDIETAPKLAYVWRFFKENISPKQVLTHGHIMSFTAIWNDEDSFIYSENRNNNSDDEIVGQLVQLLDEADLVIGHNVEAFDCHTINGRALVAGISPPSPYKIVDTYKSARREFKFEKNSLEYLCEVLNCKHKKLSHKKFPGFELWVECLAGNEEAWEEMRDYNIMDTFSVRDVYKKMRPWIRNHPNVAVHLEIDGHACPKCGSTHVQRRGYAYTNSGKYQRFRCNSCGGWARSRYTEYPTEKKKELLANAV